MQTLHHEWRMNGTNRKHLVIIKKIIFSKIGVVNRCTYFVTIWCIKYILKWYNWTVQHGFLKGVLSSKSEFYPKNWDSETNIAFQYYRYFGNFCHNIKVPNLVFTIRFWKRKIWIQNVVIIVVINLFILLSNIE